MVEIKETEEGKYRALNDEGVELGSSPFNSKKEAKIQLNKHKMKDETTEKSESEDEDTSEDESDEETEEETSYSDETTEKESFNGVKPSTAIGLGIGILGTRFIFNKFFRSNKEEAEQTQKPSEKDQAEDEPEKQESQEQENDDRAVAFQ